MENQLGWDVQYNRANGVTYWSNLALVAQALYEGQESVGYFIKTNFEDPSYFRHRNIRNINPTKGATS